MQNTFVRILVFFLILAFIGGCGQQKEDNRKTRYSFQDSGEDLFLHKTTISYSQGFTVEYYPNFKVVTVQEPIKNASNAVKYLLVQKGTPIPDHKNDIQVITIPIESIASISTSHLPFLELINEHHKLTGFANPELISSPNIRKRVNNGTIRNIGPDGSLNLEALADLDPGLLMAYGTGTNKGIFDKIERMGIPVVLNADFLETTALGRAEWIKFVSLFFNKEKEADSVFNYIKKNYESLRAKANEVREKPKVYSGIVYGDIWYVPGGKSWAAELLEHAGADYLWKSSNTAGSLELSFEKVYETASEADFWIGVASFNSLQEIKAAEPRYAEFKAFKNGGVFSYNARIGEKGGNEYMETGFARPDIILGDLIKILHPELLPEHEMYFYKKIPSKEDPQI